MAIKDKRKGSPPEDTRALVQEVRAAVPGAELADAMDVVLDEADRRDVLRQDGAETHETVDVRYKDGAGEARTVTVHRGVHEIAVDGGHVRMTWGETFPETLLSAAFHFANPADDLLGPEPKPREVPPGRFLVLDLDAVDELPPHQRTEVYAGLGIIADLTGAFTIAPHLPAKVRELGALMLILERLAPLADDRLAAVKSAMGERLGPQKEFSVGGRLVTGKKAAGKGPRYPWTITDVVQRSLLVEE